MNLQEYTPFALETALPSALRLEYVVPGLVAETGELFGKRAKSIRDQWSDERYCEEALGEVGDIAWFVAVATSLTKKQRVPVCPEGEPWYLLMRHTQRAYSAYHNSRWLKGHRATNSRREFEYQLCQLWAILVIHSENFCGHTFDEVLAANIAKLASRKSRGALEGSGDNR